MKPYKSIILAKCIAAYLNERTVDMNMTKIQKLMYISYGLYLALYEDRLVDEHPQAWPYGPVFPASRNKLSKMNLYEISKSEPDLANIVSNERVSALMDMVYDSFGQYSASQLSAWSHKEGSPWEKAVSQQGFRWGGQMDDGDIRSYFKRYIVNE